MAERTPSRASISPSARAAAGTFSTSGRSMPEYCEPWPGKTKATCGRTLGSLPIENALLFQHVASGEIVELRSRQA